MSRALFIGRFQPLHKGHEYALNYILEREDEVIVAVGSTQDNFTLNNPLTTGERIEIIWEYLRSRNLTNRVIICSVPDINNNFVWPRHVMSLVPKFDIVYSGNELVLMLFESAGVSVHRILEKNREEYQGTMIRRKILRGEPWEQYVPKIVARMLKQLGFEERIRRLAKTPVTTKI